MWPQFPQRLSEGLPKWPGPKPPTQMCPAAVCLWVGSAAVVTVAPAGCGSFPHLGPPPCSWATFALKGPMVGVPAGGKGLCSRLLFPYLPGPRLVVFECVPGLQLCVPVCVCP